MALRREYTLGHSEFNDFLFAFVGEEKSGQQLTVLSALARLGLDPWGEAARLAGLSRDAATRALTVTIGTLPEGDWEQADAPSIASRLIDLLPNRRSPMTGPAPTSTAKAGGAKPGIPRWMIWIALAAAVLLAISQYNAARGLPSGADAAPPDRSFVAGVAVSGAA